MRLDGVYENDEATVPEKVRVTGTQEEWNHVSRPIGTQPVREMQYDPFRGWEPQPSHKHEALIPPDRDLVRDIARNIDTIECDDKRLIDWMKG
jgi:hypothetical protein